MERCDPLFLRDRFLSIKIVSHLYQFGTCDKDEELPKQHFLLISFYAKTIRNSIERGAQRRPITFNEFQIYWYAITSCITLRVHLRYAYGNLCIVFIEILQGCVIIPRIPEFLEIHF